MARTNPETAAEERAGTSPSTSTRTALRAVGILALSGAALVLTDRHSGRVAPSIPAAAPVHIPTPAPTPTPVRAATPTPTPDPCVNEEAEEELIFDARTDALASVLARMRVKDPELLAATLRLGAEGEDSGELAFLLAIARTETDGRILAISPSGAAGLAQATPVAILQRGVDGPLYVTDDYILGTLAYVTKKPLDDASRVAEHLIRGTATFAEAREMLERARALQTVGHEELDLLAPHFHPAEGASDFPARIIDADAVNEVAFDELATLIEREAPRNELRRYHARVRQAYRGLRAEQRLRWERYQQDLTEQRNAVLMEAYPGKSVGEVLRADPYGAGKLLGQALDVRFDPRRMAVFLRAHVEGIRLQLAARGLPDTQEMVAQLYNSGALNTMRAHAGVAPLPGETRSYVRRVSQTRDKLHTALSQVPSSDAVSQE